MSAVLPHSDLYTVISAAVHHLTYHRVPCTTHSTLNTISHAHTTWGPAHSQQCSCVAPCTQRDSDQGCLVPCLKGAHLHGPACKIMGASPERATTILDIAQVQGTEDKNLCIWNSICLALNL